MKQPKIYAFLGLVKKLLVAHGDHEYTHTFYKNNEMCLLLATSEKNTIACVRVNPKNYFRPSDDDIDSNLENLLKVDKKFSTFMDFNPSHIIGLNMAKLKLKQFGTAKSIVYDSDKYFTEDSYIHTFTSKVNVYVPQSNNGMNPKYILLNGKNLRLTRGGIEG
jgi:hypothetical protein